MRHGKTENERAICIDRSLKGKISQLKNKLNESIEKLDPELKLAILAELVDECLEHFRLKSSEKEVKKRAENE